MLSPGDELKEKLQRNKQEHLLQFLDELQKDLDDEQGRSKAQALLDDLAQIDFDEVSEYYARLKQEDGRGLDNKLDMQPIPSELKGSSSSSSSNASIDKYREAGLAAIAAGQVAVLLLAGGQGTRLGVTYPKGMYSVGLPSAKTLYQLQAERLLKVQELAAGAAAANNTAAAIPCWYIMTSEHTKELTERFFAEHGHFGVGAHNVHIFEQFMLPCLSGGGEGGGRILLDEKWKVSKSPDGNGGLYKALHKRGVLADMRARGVKYVHVYGVDNILIRMADPVFIGFCLHKQADCAAKVHNSLHFFLLT
jgi:UDP-N-acetylglucosamine/UDP-N-acetylgalactosamine diphosphorylase